MGKLGNENLSYQDEKETTFEKGAVHVTSSRLKIGSRVYEIEDIDSVRVARQSAKFRWAFVFLSVVLIILSSTAFLFSVVNLLASGLEFLIFSLITLLLCGVFGYFGIRTLRMRNKHLLILDTPLGQVKALTHFDRKFVHDVEEAVNKLVEERSNS